MRATFYYLYRHPITEDVYPQQQVFIWDTVNGQWSLPPEQPVLPNMVEDTEFYFTHEEALAARSQWEHRNAVTEGDRGPTENR